MDLERPKITIYDTVRSSALGEGAFGSIHKVSEENIAKIPIHWHWSRKKTKEESLSRLEREFEFNNIAYEVGLSVPKPAEITAIEFAPQSWPYKIFKPQVYPAIIREYIEGITLDKIKTKDEQRLALLDYEKEISKAADLRIVIPDAHNENAIWNREEKKVYLIDFEFWGIWKGKL